MDFRHLLEQAKNFKQTLADLDRAMGERRHSASVAGVKATVNGLGELHELQLEPSLTAAANPGQIAQAVVAAVRSAQETARQAREEERRQLLGDLELPDL